MKIPKVSFVIFPIFLFSLTLPFFLFGQTELALPQYEGPPSGYLQRKPDQVIKKGLKKSFFQKQVVENKEFLGTVRVVPFLKDAKIIGLKILTAPKDPFWTALGFREKDVLLAFNGGPPSDLFDQLQKNNPPFEFLFLREDRLIQLTVSVK